MLPAAAGAGPLMLVEHIARVCHEANRALCATHGEDNQPPWREAPGWQVESAIAGVTGILDGTINSPRESHASWMARKLAEGWQLGPEKDPFSKLHPCLVPYDELPPAQRAKEELFFAIVAVLGLGIEVTPPATVELSVEVRDRKGGVVTAHPRPISGSSPDQPPPKRQVLGMLVIDPADLNGKSNEEAVDLAFADLRPRILAQVAEAQAAIAKTP